MDLTRSVSIPTVDGVPPDPGVADPPRSELSWWLAEALAARPHDPPVQILLGDRSASVAIVGGGYTGLWTAYQLKERRPDLDVAVLEASVCGWGASGRNGGFYHGYWGRIPDLREKLGDQDTLAVADTASASIDALQAFCARWDEDVWLRVGGVVKVSTAPAEDAKLSRLIDAARAVGRPEEVVPLSPAEVAERIRSPHFRGGLLIPRAGHIHPGRFVRALRRAAIELGVAVYEGSPVERLHAGEPSVLVTPTGRLRADEVVVGVGAVAAGWPPMGRRITVVGSQVVLTEPIPELLEQIGWTGDEAVTDNRKLLAYFRKTDDDRIAWGSTVGAVGYAGRIDHRLLDDAAGASFALRDLRRLLPELREVRAETSWGGGIDLATDHLPIFGTVPGKRIHYCAGFSGMGAAQSWIAGNVLASLALGTDDDWARFPLVGRDVSGLPPEPWRYVGAKLTRAALISKERAEAQGRRAPLAARVGSMIPRLIGRDLGGYD